MTGTAINPLLRAFYLSEQGTPRQITLVVPWLAVSDQARVYPHNLTFETPDAQEKYVRSWVEQRTGRSADRFKVSFYPARYAREKGSILPVGDLTKVRLSANNLNSTGVLDVPCRVCSQLLQCSERTATVCRAAVNSSRHCMQRHVQ